MHGTIGNEVFYDTKNGYCLFTTNNNHFAFSKYLNDSV